MLHYLTIAMFGLQGSEINDVHAAMVSVVHHHNIKSVDYQNRVAIAFPDYREGVDTDATKARSYGEEQRLVRSRRGFLGRTIRLFGKAQHLQSILSHPNCAFLADTQGISVDTPSVIPQTAQYGSYQRHKGMTNATPSRLRRAISRKISGKSLSTLTDRQMDLIRRNKQQVAHKTHLPNVGVWSVSTGSQFSIFIEKKETMQLNFTPDTYGFSTNSVLCSLPVF